MKRFINTIVILAVCAILAYLTTENNNPDTNSPATADALTVTFIDVGQGDSALIETAGGTKLLIDGGEYSAYDEQLAPFLASRRITTIDYALASHYHTDHMGGISELLETEVVSTLIIPKYDDKNQNRERLVAKAKKNSVEISEICAGDVLDLGDPNLEISVLHPLKGGFSQEDENNNSLVLMLKYFDEKFLFTGDLEDDAEQVLVKNYNLEADVLKVGHHGSSSSTSPKFLAEVDPTYAVIEAGNGNRYGHPHYEVLSALENDDVRIYRTDEDGDITFTVTSKGIESITTERGAAQNGD
ncbi:MAG: MBL fold metallo-hydrolase [Ruminococcaceae bacterium]|nr:MBL fold metallo-hydrolase [Oscillospiraceae bacterium]